MNSTSAENGSTSILLDFPSHLVEITMVAGSANIILGLPLNVYILWLILTKASGTMASEFFSLNLAVSEIFFCLSTIWYFLFVQLKSIGCYKAYIFFAGLIYTGRPLFQCCICVERYVGVVYPVVFLRYKPLRYRVACCSVVWLMVLASCIYSEFTSSNYLYLYGFFIQNLLLLAVMLFCCLSVLRALKRPGPGGEERKRGNNMKRRAFRIILLIMISMFMNFLLYMTAIPLQCCLDSLEFQAAMTICFCLALTTGFVQPLLYIHRAGKLICCRDL